MTSFPLIAVAFITINFRERNTQVYVFGVYILVSCFLISKLRFPITLVKLGLGFSLYGTVKTPIKLKIKHSQYPKREFNYLHFIGESLCFPPPSIFTILFKFF